MSVHATVWWATVRDPHDVDALLDDADREYLAWLQSDRARAESATARALLRGVLATLQGITAHQVVITRACPDCAKHHGRPLVPGWHVSASHTDGRVAVGSAEAPVGIDLEWAAPQRFAELEFDATEWTRREAYLKALGVGLRTDPATVTPHDAVDVQLGVGYAAALCVPGHHPAIEVIAADDLLTTWAASAAVRRTATA